MKDPVFILNALEKKIEEQFKTIEIILFFDRVCADIVVKIKTS